MTTKTVETAAPAEAQTEKDTFEGCLALTVPEALTALRMSRSGFYAAVGRGEIGIVKIGRKTLVPLAPLRAKLRGDSGWERGSEFPVVE